MLSPVVRINRASSRTTAASRASATSLWRRSSVEGWRTPVPKSPMAAKVSGAPALDQALLPCAGHPVSPRAGGPLAPVDQHPVAVDRVGLQAGHPALVGD